MSTKKFETQLYIKNYKNNVINELIALGVSDLHIKVFDNWQYENETQIYSLNSIEENVNTGKIVVIEGKYNKLNCGCYISRVLDCYEFDIWISADIDSGLESECISNRNIYIYDRVIDMIKKWIAPQDLIFCFSGIEMLVEYSEDLSEILDNSSGILQIICTRNTIKTKNLSCSIKQDGDYLFVRP